MGHAINRLMALNPCFPVGGALGKHMEHLGDGTLLKKVHNWGWPLIVHSLISLLLFSLCLLLMVEDVVSQLLETLDKTNSSLCKLLWPLHFIATSKSN